MIFRKKHVKKILASQKTQTRRRINLRHSYKVGKKYGIRSGWYEKAVAHIIITGKRIERLGDITSEDAQKEGGYTIEEFRREWKQINGKWRPDLEVYVYDFQLVKSQTV